MSSHRHPPDTVVILRNNSDKPERPRVIERTRTAAMKGPYGMIAPLAKGTDHQLSAYAATTNDVSGCVLTTLRNTVMGPPNDWVRARVSSAPTAALSGGARRHGGAGISLGPLNEC